MHNLMICIISIGTVIWATAFFILFKETTCIIKDISELAKSISGQKNKINLKD